MPININPNGMEAQQILFDCFGHRWNKQTSEMALNKAIEFEQLAKYIQKGAGKATYEYTSKKYFLAAEILEARGF